MRPFHVVDGENGLEFPTAPSWQTTAWLNTPQPLDLDQLRGRVVLLHAFQMLCPGCVARGIPQAQRVAEAFSHAPLTVVGLHTVFEHHDAMQLPSLRAFAHEYRIEFPIGVDAASKDGSPTPQTMALYKMRGTPTTVLIDARGRIRKMVFGAHDDLLLGAALQTLILEAGQESDLTSDGGDEPAGDCDSGKCEIRSDEP